MPSLTSVSNSKVYQSGRACEMKKHGGKHKSKTAASASGKEVVDLSDNQECEQPSSAASTTKAYDGSNMFRRLGVYDKNKNNSKVRCTLCNWEGFQSHAETHIRSKHPSQLDEYLDKKRSKQAVLPFEPKKPLTPSEVAELRLHEGTVENLEKNVAKFLVLRRLPFEVANSLEFFDVIKTSMNLGLALSSAEVASYRIPSRNTMIDTVIEGPHGLLADYVNSACRDLDVLVADSAPSIIYDGAKDATGRSVELFCLQAGNKVVLLWTGLPNTNSKSHTWTHDCLKGLLDGDMDFQLMDARNAEDEPSSVASSVVEAVEVLSSSSSSSKKKRKTSLIPHLSRLFSYTPYVVAVGGDNASTPLLAAKLLGGTRGVLYFGCVAHAFSRCYEHVCQIPAIKKHVVDKIEAIADIFLSYSQPREILRKFSRGKSVYRIVPTRFITVYLAGNRLIELKHAISDSVDDPQFRDFIRTSTTKGMKNLGASVIDAVQDEQFWKCLEFLLKMSVGFVVAVRCFDGALQGSVCLVYQFWSTLSQTVAGVFKDHSKSCPSFATRELYDDIKKVVMADWYKFLYPVYCAAYFLCPYFVDQVRYYEQHYPDWFTTLYKHTVDCCCTVYRRFNQDGTPREIVLDASNVLVTDMRKIFEDQLYDYIRKRGSFNSAMFEKDALRAPTDWWRLNGSKSPLRHIASKIVSISPSTAPVERNHKLTKSIRTKSRNSIGYARALGLNFICAEHIMRNCKDVKFSWSELENYKVRFASLTKSEDEYLQDLAEEQTKTQTALEKDDELIVSVEELAEDLAQATIPDPSDSSTVELAADEELEATSAMEDLAFVQTADPLMFPDINDQQ
jgi:hypothetical protein